jgi:hypothetical protein
VVLALSLVAPGVVAADKAIQLSRQRKAQTGQGPELKARPVIQATT